MMRLRVLEWDDLHVIFFYIFAEDVWISGESQSGHDFLFEKSTDGSDIRNTWKQGSWHVTMSSTDFDLVNLLLFAP